MKKAIAFSTLMFMLCTTLLYPIAAQEQMNEVQQAEADARRDVNQDISTISWGIGGLFVVCLQWDMHTSPDLQYLPLGLLESPLNI